MYRKHVRELWDIGGCGKEIEGVLDGADEVNIFCRYTPVPLYGSDAVQLLNLQEFNYLQSEFMCDMDTKTYED